MTALNQARDKAELRRLALKATAGPWYVIETDGADFTAISTDPKNRDWTKTEVLGTSEWLRCDEEDLRFIAAANPAAILSLLDELEGAQRALESARDRIDTIVTELAQVPLILSQYPQRVSEACDDTGRLARDLQRVYTGLDAALAHPPGAPNA